MGDIVTFASNGGTAQGYLAKPASGAGKGVVVFQEWWGLNDNIKGIADRFAEAGFVALAPDMYHGTVTDEPDEAGKLLMALNIEQAAKDARGAIQHLKSITGGPVGTVGYCMGGALSLFAACKNGDDVGACIDYYGGHPKVTYDWDSLTAPVLAFWAAHDDWVNANIPVYEEALRSRGKSYESHQYPGTQHAFFNDERTDGGHDKAASDDSWRRSVEFFAKHL